MLDDARNAALFNATPWCNRQIAIVKQAGVRNRLDVLCDGTAVKTAPLPPFLSQDLASRASKPSHGHRPPGRPTCAHTPQKGEGSRKGGCPAPEGLIRQGNFLGHFSADLHRSGPACMRLCKRDWLIVPPGRTTSANPRQPSRFRRSGRRWPVHSAPRRRSPRGTSAIGTLSSRRVPGSPMMSCRCAYVSKFAAQPDSCHRAPHRMEMAGPDLVGTCLRHVPVLSTLFLEMASGLQRGLQPSVSADRALVVHIPHTAPNIATKSNTDRVLTKKPLVFVAPNVAVDKRGSHPVSNTPLGHAYCPCERAEGARALSHAAVAFDRRKLKPTKTHVCASVERPASEFGRVKQDGKPLFPSAQAQSKAGSHEGGSHGVPWRLGFMKLGPMKFWALWCMGSFSSNWAGYLFGAHPGARSQACLFAAAS
eukprot:177131-Pelagomonas_calceolata.AAC.1